MTKSPLTGPLGLSTTASDQRGILNRRSCLHRAVKTKVKSKIRSLEFSASQLEIPEKVKYQGFQ